MLHFRVHTFGGSAKNNRFIVGFTCLKLKRQAFGLMRRLRRFSPRRLWSGLFLPVPRQRMCREGHDLAVTGKGSGERIVCRKHLVGCWLLLVVVGCC